MLWAKGEHSVFAAWHYSWNDVDKHLLTSVGQRTDKAKEQSTDTTKFSVVNRCVHWGFSQEQK